MIRTKASQAKQSADVESFKVVKFEARKKTSLPKQNKSKFQEQDEEDSAADSDFDEIFGDGPSKKKKPKKDKNEVTYQSARREIINFGISGSSDKIELKTQLAIKLGAKPKKNIARNYKEILEEKRKEKAADSKVNKRTLFGTSATLQLRNQRWNNKTTPKKDGLLGRYGKVEKADKQFIKNNLNKKMSRKR